MPSIALIGEIIKRWMCIGFHDMKSPKRNQCWKLDTMASDPTIREAYKAFTDYIDRQKVTVQSIKMEIREGRAQISDTQKELSDRIAAAFPTVESFPADVLTEIAQEAGTAQNFSLLYSGMVRENERLSEERRGLIKTHGAPENLATEKDALGAAILAQMTVSDNKEGQVRRLTRMLSPLDARLEKRAKGNEGGVDEALVRDTVDYYATSSLGRYFSPDWWGGHSIVTKYQTATPGGIAADWKKREDVREEWAQTRRDTENKNERYGVIETALGEMTRLENAKKTPSDMARVLQERLFEALFDEKFIEGMKDKMGVEAVAPFAEPVLKIMNLTKVGNNLEKVLEATEATLGKLEAPYSKLRRGVSRAGSKRIHGLDLDDVEAAVAGQEKFAASMTKNTQQVRAAIGTYHYASPPGRAPEQDNTFWYMMNAWMIISILDTSSADEGFVTQTLDNAIVPDLRNVDVAVHNGAGGLNAIANQAFDVPDINTPDFSVPDIAVPEFSIPEIPNITVDVPSYSDSGSSFSSSDY